MPLPLQFDFFSVITLSSVLFSTIVTVAILIKSSRAGGRNLSFGLFILSVNISIFNIGFLIYTGNYRIFPHLLSVSSVTTFLVGPFFYYFTVNAVSAEKIKIKMQHFLPFCIFLCIDIPYLLKSGDEKITMLESLFSANKSSLNALLTGSISSIGIIHMSVYICASWFVLSAYKESVLNNFSVIPEKLHRWLQTTVWYMSMVMAVLLIALAASIVAKTHFNVLFRTVMVTAPVFLCFLVMKVLLQPEYFLFEPGEIPRIVDEKKSGVMPDVDLARQVAQAVDNKKLYRLQELTISDLAEEVGISRTLLSEIINKHFEVNFYDFINGFRINDAKRQIELNPDDVNFNRIASDSGFKSRTTFNVCFKRYENLTPTQFCNLIKKNLFALPNEK